MKINRSHERRYYRHSGDWYFGFGTSRRVWVRAQLTTPRHRFNLEVWRGPNRPWLHEVARLQDSI